MSLPPSTHKYPPWPPTLAMLLTVTSRQLSTHSSIKWAPSASVSCVRNTAALFCMILCMLRRTSAVRRLPEALRSLSRRAMLTSPASAGKGACFVPGLRISPAKERKAQLHKIQMPSQ